MYQELSKDTDDFFNMMINDNLLDLVNRKGKMAGGFCTCFFDHKRPYIFANFNGTDHDITVLTHEVGHAFQYYCSKNQPLLEYTWPTLEACEIHSMSMEFITWPWMESFFEDEADKFRYMHMAGSLLFLPYGCLVDHFQHWVYENPTASPTDRKQAWLELENNTSLISIMMVFRFLNQAGAGNDKVIFINRPFIISIMFLPKFVPFNFGINFKKIKQKHGTIT